MKFILAIITLALTGCASTEYAQYTASQTAIATAKAQSDTARYQALAAIAATGTDSARVAAVMALAMGGGQTQVTQIASPQPNQALQWASILVPAVTQAYAIGKNAEVAIASSNNAMLTSTATTAGFVGIAGKIQAPAAANVVVPQANVTTTTSTTSTDNHASTVSTDNHAVATTTSTTSTANPTTTTTTLSGTGTLGSGTYSPQANPVTTTSTTTTNPATQIPAGVVCSVDTTGLVNCK